jgi:hypothetical protein
VKLVDGSILTVNPDTTASERFIPSLNVWTNDALLPVSLWANLQPVAIGEIGPAFLLPDGRAFFLGGSGHTALYTPSGSSAPGSWVAGPDIPGGLVAADAPGAMMVNGKILCAAAPPPFIDIFGQVEFPSPTSFFEYDPTTVPVGSFTQVPSPTGGMTDNIPSYKAAMLALPDGTILYSDEWWQLYVFHPDGSPLAAGKPVITGVTGNADRSLHLTGTLFNGISQGASYGDDAQMDSNYPLVRLTGSGGNVRYARTFDWSNTGVQTGTTPITTEAALPSHLLRGIYSLSVVANGISSDPVPFDEPVWVDFNLPCFSCGDGTFSDPYNTIQVARGYVPPADTIEFMAGSSGFCSDANCPCNPPRDCFPITFTEPVTLKAFNGPVTIGQ